MAGASSAGHRRVAGNDDDRVDAPVFVVLLCARGASPRWSNMLRPVSSREERGERHIAHYGTAPGTAGGIGAVLEVYASLDVTGHRMEVVPTYSPRARLFGAAYLLAAIRGLLTDASRRRAIYHVHFSERGSFMREGAIVLAGWLVGSPIVASLHGADFEAFARSHPHLVRAVLRRADVLCPLGPRGAAFVTSVVGDGQRVVVLPNGVEVGDDATPPPDADIVFFAGVVGLRKGVDVLLRAWPAVRAARPNAELQLAGPLDGLTEADLQVPGVTWLGALSRAEVSQRLRCSRLAVLPSRAEVLPMFLLEAMARGRAVVATDVGEVRWMVGDGGRVVGPGDSEALAHAVVSVLDDSTATAAHAEAARERAVSVFSTGAAEKRLYELYTSLPDPAAMSRSRLWRRTSLVSKQ